MLRFLFVLALLVYSLPVHAAGDAEHPPEMHWHHDGMFGQFDKAQLQRGFQVYTQVCAACHSMEKLSYRNLSALGYNEAELKAIARNNMVIDGPNDEGDMFERPGLPSDRFVSPFANKQAAGYANNGAVPPDFSLIAKARHGGANYIYGILTGYEEGHEDKLLDGQYWNRYMPGHVIAMAPPLMDGQVAYEDESPQTVDQYSKDVSAFLAWASDPHATERKQLGLKILIFLLVFAGVMYATKKKIWADKH